VALDQEAVNEVGLEPVTAQSRLRGHCPRGGPDTEQWPWVGMGTMSEAAGPRIPQEPHSTQVLTSLCHPTPDSHPAPSAPQAAQESEPEAA
jgi:hypothetical protein